MKFLLVIGFLASLLPFRHFTAEDGVAQNTILSIAQDNNDHIWLGTNDGLCRISGFHTYTFRSNAGTDSGLPSDRIDALYTDAEGRIWITTSHGVCVHRPGTQEFIKFSARESMREFLDLRSENKAECSGLFLAVGKHKVLEIDPDSLRIRASWPCSEAIRKLGYCEGKVIAGVAGEGLFTWKPEEGLVRILSQKGNSGLFSVRKDGRIWTASTVECILFDPITSEAESFNISPGLPSGHLRALATDNEGSLWIATSEGILIVREDGTTSLEQHSLSNSESIGDNSVRSLFYSRDGGMWVGTYYSGVYYHHPKSRMIRAISPTGIQGADKIICRSIEESPIDGKIWIGTANLGVLTFDPQDRSLKVFRPKRSDSDIVNAIAFAPDRRKMLFGLSDTSLEIISGGRSHKKHIGTWVFGFERYSEKYFLICGGNGIYSMDIDTERCERILSMRNSGRANCVGKDPVTGDLWIGFERLAVRARVSSGKDGGLECRVVEEYRGAEEAVDMMADSAAVWFATGSGLLRRDRSSGEWSLHNSSDGWPTNIIRGIETDSNGRMWLPSENGLIIFSPKTDEVKVLGKSFGIESLKFNPFAHCKTADGTLYFGGTERIYSFREDGASGDSPLPSPSILGIRIGEEPVEPASLVTIPAGESGIEILLDAADFTRRESLSFEYRMEGVDKSWKNAGEGNRAVYHSVPKGRHQFEVRTVGDEGLRSSAATALTVIAKKAWYESTLFYILMISLLSSIIAYAFFLQEKKSHKEIQRIEKQAKLDISGIRAEVMAARPMQPKDRELMMKVIDAVDRNIENENFGVQELADILGMSRSNLNIRMKAIADTTPLDIIRKIRLEKAYKMLLDGNHQISEVAFATGFASATYFATYFRKETGMTPREWISKNRRSSTAASAR